MFTRTWRSDEGTGDRLHSQTRTNPGPWPLKSAFWPCKGPSPNTASIYSAAAQRWWKFVCGPSGWPGRPHRARRRIPLPLANCCGAINLKSPPATVFQPMLGNLRGMNILLAHEVVNGLPDQLVLQRIDLRVPATLLGVRSTPLRPIWRYRTCPNPYPPYSSEPLWPNPSTTWSK